MKHIDLYPTYELAKKVVHDLKIRSLKEYKSRCKEDPKLPADPKTYYLSVWNMRGGYKYFFLYSEIENYPTYTEAKEAAKALNVKTAREYLKSYKADPKLRSDPKSQYPVDWVKNNGWKGFLSTK